MIEPRQFPPLTSSNSPTEGEVDYAVLCRARGDLYRFLAAASAAPPDEVLYVALSDPRNRESLAESLGDPRIAEVLAELASGGSLNLKELSDEYHSLFVVPGPRFCAPNESVFGNQPGERHGQRQPGLLWGPQTLAVCDAYRKAGYQLEPGFTDLPDHIAAELIFMARLCEDQSDALSRGAQSRAAQLEEIQIDFLRDHLGPFAPLLCATIEKNTRNAYFRALTAILRAFITAETSGIEKSTGAS